jgi:hypothetical protein
MVKHTHNNGMKLSSITSLLFIFVVANFFYFYSQIQLEHTQVSLVIQSFDNDLNKMQDRQKRSLAHITERFNELRTQVIDMEMEYDAMNDKIKQVKDVAERHGEKTRARVDEIGKKVSGIGVLLGRMPSLLQKVEAENRDSVETVNSKLNKLETLLGNPSLRNYLKSPVEKNTLQSANDLKLGDSLNPFGGSNSIGSDDTADSNIANSNKKNEDDSESPSDLPQKPRVPTDEVGDVSAGSTKDIINAHNGQLPGSLSMQSNGKVKKASKKTNSAAVSSKLSGNDINADQHGECELDLEWSQGPSALESYTNYMAVGEHWLEKEDFAKAIACFNYAEKMKVDNVVKEGKAAASNVDLDKIRAKKKTNALRMLAAKSNNKKSINGGSISAADSNDKLAAPVNNDNDNSNADMPQVVHNPDNVENGNNEINLGSRIAGTNNVKNTKSK